MGWESLVQGCMERWSFRTKWIHREDGTIFLLAWRALEVRVIRVDLSGRLPWLEPEEVQEEFQRLLKDLFERPMEWVPVFKGSEVLFQWMSLQEVPRTCKWTLWMAGVEAVEFGSFGAEDRSP